MLSSKKLNRLNRSELNSQLDFKLILKELGLKLHKNNKIFSPYNEEKEPSCLINLKDDKFKNTFKDFSSGKERSDIIQLVMDKKNIDEKNAMKYCVRKMKNKIDQKLIMPKLTPFEKRRFIDPLDAFTTLWRKFNRN